MRKVAFAVVPDVMTGKSIFEVETNNSDRQRKVLKHLSKLNQFRPGAKKYRIDLMRLADWCNCTVNEVYTTIGELNDMGKIKLDIGKEFNYATILEE